MYVRTIGNRIKKVLELYSIGALFKTFNAHFQRVPWPLVPSDCTLKNAIVLPERAK